MESKKNIKIKYEDVAVAIKYAFGSAGETPQIVASGRGLIAHQIIELAQQHKVPVKKEKALAQSLAKIPVGVDIPAELWGAMAEILAQVYLLDQQQKK